MKRNKMTVIAFLGILLLLSVSFVERTGAEKQSGKFMSADSLIGKNVVKRDGAGVGQIKDLMMDSHTGRINYIVLLKGGIIGVGGDQYAVPFQALQFDADMNRVTLTIDENKLANAPKQEAGMSDTEFNLKINEYYGISPAWGTAPVETPKEIMMSPEIMDPSEMKSPQEMMEPEMEEESY